MESKQKQPQPESEIRNVQNILAPHHSKRRRQDSHPSTETNTCNCVIGNYTHILHENIDAVTAITELVERLVGEKLEEFQRRLSLRQTINEGEETSEEAKNYELVFNNDLPDTIYTYSKIKAKDNTPIEIALRDTKSQSIVTDGTMSSIKIEICVLNVEFGNSSNHEEWKIIHQRDNKGKLLKGKTVIALKNGVGHINDIVFTDNSSWTRSRHFMLGAKVAQSNLNEGKNIREGKSNAFMVKEIRGQLNQKKENPVSLEDEIWHLIHIPKDGKIHQRLALHGINTLKDLLQLHQTNPSSLYQKFGRVSKQRREAIIEHAKTCVTQVTLNGQNDTSLNTLNSDQKNLGDNAYRNVQDFIPSLPNQLSSSQLSAEQNVPQYLHDQVEKGQYFSQPSTSHIGEAADNIDFDEFFQRFMKGDD